MRRKPDIPKRFAARIRGAQTKVTRLQDTLVHAHSRLLQDESELSWFNADPMGYVDEHYPSHGVRSYPVQTRTEQLREAVEYRRGRIPRMELELAKAERHLEEVEAEIESEVAVMRPSAGRVKWPRALPGFSGRIERALEEMQQEVDEEPERRAAYRAKLDEEYDREIEKLEEQARREDEAEARRIAKLSPEERASEREALQAFSDELSERGLTIQDFVRAVIKSN